MTLVIDLSSKILYANGNAPLSKLYGLASALHGEEGWRFAQYPQPIGTSEVTEWDRTAAHRR